MAARKSPNTKFDFTGYEKGGSFVLAQSKCGEHFRIQCKCGAVYVHNRVHVSNSRREGRNLHCEDCTNRSRQAVSRRAARTRKREGGMFV